MSKTRVVNITKDVCDVYIGRACRGRPKSAWLNPYTLVKDGTREECICKYEDYVRTMLAKDPNLKKALLALDGKVLGCWCKEPDREVPCHGDILVKLIAELKEAEHGGKKT